MSIPPRTALTFADVSCMQLDGSSHNAKMDPGVQLVTAVWVMTIVSLGLVGLRLYTRIRIVRFVGTEDHLYAWTGVLLLVFACSLQVAQHYGLGKNFWILPPESSSQAIFWTYVANTFAITGNCFAKLSMASFLLRVVQLRWQRISLWILVLITAGTSVAWVIMLWNQTTPIKASWDPIRTPGKWNIQIKPMSIGLGVWSSACDFFFAIFPWMFIWSLRMPRREKIMLASGMSLGVIAGACGITRTVVLSRLNVMNYTLNFVPYFAWAGAEIAVAMICLGVPTLRPLYLKQRGQLSIGYGSHARHTHEEEEDELPQFTMLDQKPPIEFDFGPVPSGRDSASTHDGKVEAKSNLTRPPTAHIKGPGAGYDSVDEIFSLYDQNPQRGAAGGSSHSQNSGGIWVRSEVQVSRDDLEKQDWPLRP